MSDPGDGADAEPPTRPVAPIPFPPDPLGRWLTPATPPTDDEDDTGAVDPTS